MQPTIEEILGYHEASKLRERISPQSYEVFIKRLYEDVERIIIILQDSSNYQIKSEDRLTIEIVSMLSCMYYDAAHDNNSKGHVDIIVKKDTYRWIGEAKVFSSSYQWLFKGVSQLMTRYTSGTKGQTETALLIYFFDEKVKDKMHIWKDKLKERSDDPKFKEGIGLKGIDCSVDTSLQFISQHIHISSQLEMRIRHIPILLYHNPLDPIVGS